MCGISTLFTIPSNLELKLLHLSSSSFNFWTYFSFFCMNLYIGVSFFNSYNRYFTLLNSGSITKFFSLVQKRYKSIKRSKYWIKGTSNFLNNYLNFKISFLHYWWRFFKSLLYYCIFSCLLISSLFSLSSVSIITFLYSWYFRSLWAAAIISKLSLKIIQCISSHLDTGIVSFSKNVYKSFLTSFN